MRVKLSSMPFGGPPWLVPEGHRENSPTPSALGRALEGEQVPEGRLSPPPGSTVPPGRGRPGGSNPMLKHWAIVLCPSGTVASRVRKSPKGIGLSLTRMRPPRDRTPRRWRAVLRAAAGEALGLRQSSGAFRRRRNALPKAPSRPRPPYTATPPAASPDRAQAAHRRSRRDYELNH